MLVTHAYAQAATGQPAAATAAGGFISFLPFVLIAVVGYFLLVRPQQLAQKKQRQSIEAVKKGDEVVTAGGHIGKVVRVGDTEVEVEFGPQNRHRVLKSTLSEVRPLGGARPAND